MIERYDCPEISTLWNEDSKFATYLEVELALLGALEEHKQVPAGTSKAFANIKVSPKRVAEIEAVTRHDVIAFCTAVTEQVDENVGKYFHFGCTSSDIIDTATTLQMKRSLKLVIEEAKKLQHSLWNKAKETKDITCLGRSHGMNAEPMSFANKFLSSYCEVSRRIQELEEVMENEFTGQFSGAIGNYTILSPKIEKTALDKLGLKRETISSQVIPRDRIAKMVSVNALMASAIERLAVEIRHLHHSDVGEVYEGFAKGQKGSSTMPHKKNPISGENLTGMARVLRSHLTIVHENIPLWHERDISHSSAERLMLPDNLGLMYYSLKRMRNTIDNLVVVRERIEGKVHSTFQYLSSYVLHQLIKTQNTTRENIYAKVQAAAFNAIDAKDFVARVQSEFDIDLSTISAMDMKAINSIYTKYTDEIFEQVATDYPLK